MLGSWKAPSSCTPALTCGSTGPVTVFACDPEEGGLASWKASPQEKAVGTRISANAATAKYRFPYQVCKKCWSQLQHRKKSEKNLQSNLESLHPQCLLWFWLLVV